MRQSNQVVVISLRLVRDNTKTMFRALTVKIMNVVLVPFFVDMGPGSVLYNR